MHRFGLEDLDLRLVATVAARLESRTATPPSEQVLAYLDLLDSELRLRSRDVSDTVLRQLQRVAQTETGEPIGGIELEISPQEQDLYDIDQARVDLAALPDLGDIPTRLQEVLRDLAEQRDLS
jgi:hypothetical protein